MITRLFQSQRRFFGGSNPQHLHHLCPAKSFNRRGDSLGGATFLKLLNTASVSVSIAEAILWGEQRQSCVALYRTLPVSIAEAILWGEQRGGFCPGRRSACFNRRGDSLGGATSDNSQSDSDCIMFQSQRRFFGGSNMIVC